MVMFGDCLQTHTCDAAQLLLVQLVVAELVVLRLVHECDAVSFHVGFRQKTLKKAQKLRHLTGKTDPDAVWVLLKKIWPLT